MSMMSSQSHQKIAEHLIKGTNMGIDTLQKHFNGGEKISSEVESLARNLYDILTNSLEDLRKWL